MARKRGALRHVGVVAVLLAAAAAANSAPVLVGGPVGAAPEQTDLPVPCGVSCDRTVGPLEVMVGETVHARMTCQGECPATKKAVDMFFVVDRTNTMFDKRQNGVTYMAAAKEAMIQFVNKMDFADSSVGVITYAANENVALNLSTDRDRILDVINRIRRSEETDVRGLQEVFRTATEKLQRGGTEGNLKAIVIIAAGPDVPGENINMPTVAQAAILAGVRVIFLMYPDSRYAHYVAAASDCTEAICPTWSGAGRKWAFEVDAASIGNILANTLFGVFVEPTKIAQLQVENLLHSCADFQVSSSVPPPTEPQAPPYVQLEWVYYQEKLDGIAIDYDVAMVCGGDSYQVSQMSRYYVTFSDGTQFVRILPDPYITVRNPPTVTSTSPWTATPTVQLTEVPTDTPTALVTPPSATPTGMSRFEALLPLALRDMVLFTEP